MLHREKIHFAESALVYQSITVDRREKNATMPHLCHQIAGNSRLRPARTRMKLHTTATQQYQTVTGYDDAAVEINAVSYRHSLLVLPETAPVAWPVTSFDALAPEHFDIIDATRPDVVILGTGNRQRFAHPKLTTALTARRVGVECMDNKAACRTYNILMAEGRKVALALIFEESTGLAQSQ